MLLLSSPSAHDSTTLWLLHLQRSGMSPMSMTYEELINRLAKRYGWEFAERFVARVTYDCTQPNACWEWMGGLAGARARPRVRINGQSHYVARLVLVCVLGRNLRRRHLASHTCDNGRCLRPKHLQEATASINLKDAWRRGRRSPPSLEADV